MRIGHGYDAHKLVEGRKLILGGIEIDSPKGALGHSDADCLAHAIMDALLGAASLGDIGKYFPDCNAAYKDVSSMVLLSSVCEMIAKLQMAVCNIDCTIVLEAPKVGRYIEEIRKKLAEVIAVDVDCVNVKATTTEGLGFVGQGLGIECHAVVLLADSRGDLNERF